MLLNIFGALVGTISVDQLMSTIFLVIVLGGLVIVLGGLTLTQIALAIKGRARISAQLSKISPPLNLEEIQNNPEIPSEFMTKDVLIDLLEAAQTAYENRLLFSFLYGALAFWFIYHRWIS